MSNDPQFDFWYAVNNTQVLIAPSGKLETFGTTILNYHLVTELMDAVNQVRVREGRVEAARPQIITPQAFLETPLEGFGGEAAQYVEWLREHAKDLHLLRYGFQIRKRETNEYIISDDIDNVVDRVRKAVEARDDPLTALAVGVDHPWEVSILKMMVEVVERSLEGNVLDLKQKGLFEQARKDPHGIRRQIEAGFEQAARDQSKIDPLAQLLRKYKLFEEYEDRFFALVRGHKG